MYSELVALFSRNEEEAKLVSNEKLRLYKEINMFDNADLQPFCQTIAYTNLKLVKSYLAQTSEDINQKLFYFNTITGFETPLLRKYPMTTGMFNWHFDASNLDSSRRVLAIVYYLNTVEDAFLEFSLAGETYRFSPIAGQAIIYPTSFQFLHREVSSKIKDRYVISTFALLPNKKEYPTD